MPFSGGAPVPIRPFSDWKKTLRSVRNVVGDQRRNADAEIHEHPPKQLPGDAARDDGLCVPWRISRISNEIVDKRRGRHDMIGCR